MKKKTFIYFLAAIFITALLSSGVTTALLLNNGFRGIFSGISSNTAKTVIFDGADDEEVRKLQHVYDLLNQHYFTEIDPNFIIEGAADGMANSFKDPYTVYMPKEEYSSYLEHADGSYVGIGVTVQMDENGLLTIIEPFDGSPALEVGLLRGDKIIKVDDTDVTGIRDEDTIIRMIKGVEDTEVNITVFRESENKSLEFTITRKRIKIVNVNGRIIENDIAYIRMNMFDNHAYEDFSTQVSKLTEQGAKALIVDLRDNPGGSYDQVVKICDILLPKGVIVYTLDRNGKKYEELSGEESLDIPTAILVNGYSASASEIMAGALKDHGAGVVVGTTTFGKALVQSLVGFNDGSGLKFTVSRYFTPGGTDINAIGIVPDMEVEPLEQYKHAPASQIPYEEDVQLKRAIDAVRENIK